MVANSLMMRHDEINLFDLLESIWKQKLLVVFVLVCSIVLGYGYILISPEKWTADMIISEAKPSQVDALNPPGLLLIDRNRDQADENAELFTKIENATSLMILVSAELKSVRTLLEFNAQYPGGIFKSVKSMTEEALIDAAHSFMSNKLKLSHSLDNPSQIIIELTLESPQHASRILKNFVQFVAKKIIKSREEHVNLLLKQALERNQIEIELSKIAYAKQLEMKLAALHRALRIAKLVGVKTPQGDLYPPMRPGNYFNYSDDHLAFLGETFLQAEIKVVSESFDGWLLDPVISDLQALNEMIRSIVMDTSEAAPFYVQKPATVPTSRDSPDTNFVLGLTALVGGMLGILIALIRFSVSNYQKRSDA